MDVVFTLSLETLDDVVRREYCRPPDQGLLAVARSPDVSRLAVADPWRSWPGAVVRRRDLRSRETVTVAGREVGCAEQTRSRFPL
jgi:teichuronic acid biosynthesis glycosyltransferase TuaH